jgi:hypothetical protein
MGLARRGRQDENYFTRQFPESGIPTKVKFFPEDPGVWRFEGRTSYAKLLEGILPKVPRSRPGSSG